jgi:adenylate cyclase
MARNFGGRLLRLRPSILTVFVLLTVPVSFTVLAVTYVLNDRAAHANAHELVERFRGEAIRNIQADFNPLKSLTRSAAVVGGEEPDFFFGDRSLKYFFSILQHSDQIVSVYVGMNDGSFRQARRIDPKVKVHDRLPPAGAVYAYRWIEKADAPGRSDHYLFLDAEGRELGKAEGPTTYDPRARFWHRTTVAAGKLTVTDPDVFAALGLIGFTVASPFYADGKLLGVVATDLTLEDMGLYLAQRKISPGSLSYMLNHQGQVIAASDLSASYASDRGRIELTHVSSLRAELPAVAFGARPRNVVDGASYSFSHNGREYLASLSTMPPEFGKRWQLFTITPLEDFTAGFRRNNERLLLFGLGATALQILIIYLLSGILSAPLEKLARKVDRIQEFDQHDLPALTSSIREISVLSRAIDTLDIAVKSFAAFVPVGLVRKLLESDQKLELGGHSRFLTIMFSDLESFSALSETIPSQELLLRVSAYLELVTRTVDQEQGTIDKFIGDGVMAFWGAPALLEDHAFRSCVAAMRICKGMDVLNGRWEAEGLKALRLRIGIHCDAVLVGNIGSKERMSYTVLGDGVNVAARLEGMNKEFGTRVCLSHNVYKEAGQRLCVRPVDDVVVKGRRAKFPMYELMGVYGCGPELEPSAADVALADLTRAAYEALVVDDNALALQRYNEILRSYPDDPVARQMARKLTPTLAASA